LPSLTFLPQWNDRGPGPIQIPGTKGDQVGAVESLVVGPPIAGTDGQTHYLVYAGTVNGGIWRAGAAMNGEPTGDITPGMLTGGDTTQLTWYPLSDNQPSLAISSLALDPTDPSGNTLWAGTGSLSSAGNGGGQAVGLLKGTGVATGGAPAWTWLGKDLSGERIVSVVPTAVTDPGTSQQVVLVAALDGAGVMRSKDGGQTFQAVRIVDQSGNPVTDARGNQLVLSGAATDLIADPLNKDRFYAAVVPFGGTSKSAVFESDNDGATWTEMPGDGSAPTITGSDNMKLAAQATSGGTLLFVATGASGVITGAFEGTVPSSGGGVTQWAQIGSVPTGPGGYIPPEDSGSGHFAATADPTANGVFYVAGYQGNAIFRIARGASWAELAGPLSGPSLVNSSFVHADERHLAFLGTSSLLVANDGGVYGLGSPLSAGTSGYLGQWTSLNGNLGDTEFYSATYDPGKSLIFAGAQDNNAVIQAPDNSDGQKWAVQPFLQGTGAPAANNGDGFQTAIDAGNNEYYVANSTLYRNGTTVSLAGQNPADQAQFNSGGFGGETIAASPLFANRIMVGYTGLYESTDGGNTVSPISLPGQNPGAKIISNSGIGKVIAYGPDAPIPKLSSTYEPAYVADNAGQIWVRKPLVNFTQVTPPWGGSPNVISIAVDPNDYRYAYFLLSDGEVWETTSAGGSGSWQELDLDGSAGLAPPGSLSWFGRNLDTLAIVSTPSTPAGGGALLAGGLGGVFQLDSFETAFNGPAWFQLGRNLPNALVTQLEYVPPDSNGGGDFVLAATLGRGAWTLDAASSSVGQPGTLRVAAPLPAGSNLVQVQLDPDNRGSRNYLQVLVNGLVAYDGPFSFDALDIQASDLGDYVEIDQVPPWLTVDITSGPAGTVTIGNQAHNDLSGVLGTVNVSDATAGGVTLNIDDTGDSQRVGRTFTLRPLVQSTPADSIVISGLGTVNFQQGVLTTLTIGGDDFGNNFVVNTTGLSCQTILNLGNGKNTVDVAETLGPLFIDGMSGSATVTLGGVSGLGHIGAQRLQQPVALENNTGGSTDLTVDDSQDPVSQPDLTYWDQELVLISTRQITGLAPATIDYREANLTSLTVKGGSGGNAFWLLGTPGPTTIQAGAGGDHINLGSNSGIAALSALDPLESAVTLIGSGSGGMPNTVVNLDDEGGTPAAAPGGQYRYAFQYDAVAGKGSFSRTGTATVTFSGLAAVNLSAADAGSNVLDVAATAPGTTYNLYAGTGPNEFDVSDANNTLNGIQGPLFLHGTGGSAPTDDVKLTDIDPTTHHTFLVSAGATPQSGEVQRFADPGMLRPDMAPVSYDGINASAALATAGSAGATVNVPSEAANILTVLDVGTGDTVHVGDANHTTASLLGDLRVQAAAGQTPAVNLDDSGEARFITVGADPDGATAGYLVSGLLPPSSTGRGRFSLDAPTANVALSGSGVGNDLTVSLNGDFTESWTISGFATSSFTVLGNFSGSLLAPTLGTAAQPVQQVQIGDSLTAPARIKVNYLDSLSVGADLAGTVLGYGNGGSQNQPTIGTVTVGGNFNGTITAPVIGSINQQPASLFSGHASETAPGADFQSLVLGTVTGTAVINAGAIVSATVAGDMAGQITVSGPLDTLTVGGNLTGTVSAATIGIVVVGGNLAGQVTASQSLGSVTAAGKPVTQSIFLLDPSADAALNVSANAQVNIPGSLFVDSSSPAAVTAGGSAQVTAVGIQVVGGVEQSGSATLRPAPATGASAFPDPLAFLSGPNPAGLAAYGSASYTSGSHPLQPGIYSQIKASGNASLTLSPGLYLIEGGGLTVADGASISGAGVTIYNTGSNYPNPGGNFGGITLSGNGSFTLTPATTAAAGAYPGIVIYQSRANTRALALGGNAGAGLVGMVYAPSAPVVIGGNASLNAALVADRLQVSGNGASTQVVTGAAGDNSSNPDTLLAGDLEVYVSDANGAFTANELARIRDAIDGLDKLLAPYNVVVTEVGDPALANLVIDTGTTSAAGSAADGVLGSYSASGEITLLQGWNWYDGADPTQIGANQYDFQTVVTHELGHALGLGGSPDPNSVMFETLGTGVVRRALTVADLNIADPPEGADPERAAPPHDEGRPGSESVALAGGLATSPERREDGPALDLDVTASSGPGVGRAWPHSPPQSIVVTPTDLNSTRISPGRQISPLTESGWSLPGGAAGALALGADPGGGGSALCEHPAVASTPPQAAAFPSRAAWLQSALDAFFADAGGAAGRGPGTHGLGVGCGRSNTSLTGEDRGPASSSAGAAAAVLALAGAAHVRPRSAQALDSERERSTSRSVVSRAGGRPRG
jgi:hypothetical protein